MSWIEDWDINIFPASRLLLNCVKRKYFPGLTLKLNAPLGYMAAILGI